MNTNIQNKGSENTPSTGFLRNLSIKKKLVLIIMLVSSVGLLLAGSSFILYEWYSFRQRMVKDLTVHAEMLANNCTGSLSFNDPQDAEEVLNSLRAESPIEFACIYNDNGTLFAKYQRKDFRLDTLPEQEQDGYRFGNGRLVMFKQITLNNQPIGTVYLQSDLSELFAFLKQNVIALTVMIFLSSIIAYFLASRLQRVVSIPIFYLAKIASIVTQKGDYSVRAKKHSKDELGVLTDAFNNMLIQVEKREISLRESEEKYRSLFEAAGDAIFMLKVIEEGKVIVIDCNEHTLDIFGCSRADIIGKSPEDFSPSVQPDGRLSHEVIFEITKAALDGKIKFVEFTHSKLDGTLFDAEVTINRLDIEKNSYLQAIVRDVTKRKRAEKALLQEKAFTDVVINSLPGIFFVYDEGQRLIKWNKNHETITGYSSEELSQMHALDWFAGEDKGKVATTIKQVLTLGEATVEANLIIKDGTRVPYFFTGTRLRRSEGNYLIGMAVDITDIKKAEEALQESEEKYRTLFERSADAVLIIEGDNFVDCNSATVKMLGYKNKKELLNTHPSQLSPPLQPDGQDSFEKANQMMAMAFDRGSNRFEWDHQRKNGEVFPVEVLLTSIPFKEGNFLHVVWRDITERKQAEKELERYRKHLEKLVKERTLELEKAQEELVRKERLAALGELIATVSHEIRNPLGTVRNAIFSIGEAIGKNEMDRVNHSVELAERNIKRCNRIINELLDFTRNREIKLEKVDIDSWLSDVLDEQELPDGIECIRELHSGIVIPIDREYMRRAVENVVTNANQALQDENSKGNQLNVKSVENGERLELHFIDNGPGIPEENLDKIFEPLFSTRSFGVGLGMPIIKNIMEEHHGGLEIKSKVGQGTTVTLWLPILKLGGENEETD